MGYAIKCYFTPETAEPIYKMWDGLAKARLATFLKESGSRPGITLCVWDHAYENSLVELLHAFAKTAGGLIEVSSFGVAAFPTNPSQVFLGIATNMELLSFHQKFHEISPELTSKGSAYYQPGNWIPHSTLAIRCPPASVPSIVENCLQHNTVLQMTIGSIGLLETGTARQIAEVAFQ